MNLELHVQTKANCYTKLDCHRISSSETCLDLHEKDIKQYKFFQQKRGGLYNLTIKSLQLLNFFAMTKMAVLILVLVRNKFPGNFGK